MFGDHFYAFMVMSWPFLLQPEEMTRMRSLNRQLQIDIDCTLKETDLLQSRGTRAHAQPDKHNVQRHPEQQL